MKENTVNKDIPVPTGIKINSRTSDIITLKWDSIEGINGKLEMVFKAEDAHIQSAVKMIKENIVSEDPEEVRS